MTLKDFVVLLKKNMESEQVPLDSIRLNGGAASHVIGMRQMIDDIGYNDLDLIFGLKSDDEQVFDTVRLMLYATLRSLLPGCGTETSRRQLDDSNGQASGDEGTESSDVRTTNNSVSALTDSVIDDGYVHKMVKVSNNNDNWSLISLYNNNGENVEVKFVHRMKRQYEFSVDSFQIELDSLLSYYESITDDSVSFSKDFYPTVMAESKYGKFDEALFHLNNKLVATLRPEEIRGGGLLKYCNLLLNGYNIADSEIKNMERYMCSRFFIDFPDASSQQNKLQNYLRTHLRKAPRSARRKNAQNQNSSSNLKQQSHQFSSSSESNEDKENLSNDCSTPVHISVPNSQMQKEYRVLDDGSLEHHRINFLWIARRIIDESTVCLMNIERACTLNLLDSLINDLFRVYIVKAERLKMCSDMAESGYYSENSSTVSNPLSSPSHFSRSSSPGISLNGTTSHASRSSSPSAAAAAVFGINAQHMAPSRLAHFDLAALCVPANGSTFLHPASANGMHFNSTQFFHPAQYGSTMHTGNISFVAGNGGSFATSSRGVDQTGLSMSHQNYHNHCHNQSGNNGGGSGRHSSNGGSYHHGNNHHYQYNHHHHHHNQSKSHGGGSRNKGSNRDNYHYHYPKGNNHASGLSSSVGSYHHGNQFFSSHSGNGGGQFVSNGPNQNTQHYPSASYVYNYGNDNYTEAFPPLSTNRSVGNSNNQDQNGYYYHSSYYGSNGNVSGCGANYSSNNLYQTPHQHYSRGGHSPRQNQSVASSVTSYSDWNHESPLSGTQFENEQNNDMNETEENIQCSARSQRANSSAAARGQRPFDPNEGAEDEENDDGDDDVTSTSETSILSRDQATCSEPTTSASVALAAF